MARNNRTRKPCVIDGCDALAIARGWCRKHYTRWHQHGDVETVIDQSRGTCTIDGCEGAHKGHGYCDMHYRRWQRHGDPLIQGKRRAQGSPEQRFWEYVDFNGPIPELCPELGRCWIWTGFVDPRTGYGQHGVGRGQRPAHTWGYERYVAPIPKGMEPDHLCRNRACVRFLGHLEPVTRPENQRRGFAARVAEGRRASHCPQGHPYEDGSFYLRKTGVRVCKSCQRGRSKERYQQLVAGRPEKPPKTHCPKGHSFDEANSAYTPQGWRYCRTCKREQTNRSYAARRRS